MLTDGSKAEWVTVDFVEVGWWGAVLTAQGSLAVVSRGLFLCSVRRGSSGVAVEFGVASGMKAQHSPGPPRFPFFL